MYRVLYRKWRPQSFADVVGQEHITQTLLNELQGGKTAHAYLFTGSRGTGKTTCAKILAKAVNCEHPVDGNPCNECELCKGIDAGSVMDVIEIDAASNNGVDNIRDLREEANFTPVKAKYRVYIIDEVHMLSIGAFNALLKTLEEPPAHVKFILATTEVHKLPATILSRCQRFDFRRIEPEKIAERLSYVAQCEGMKLYDDAAMLIARIADGALRDALSLLDQCAGTGEEIDAGLVGRIAGITGRDYLFSLASYIQKQDCAGALSLLNELHRSSCDMERLCDQLTSHFRNLMIAKTSREPGSLIVCTEHELEQLAVQANTFTLEKILYVLDILEATVANLRKGLDRRTQTEMALVRLCSPSLDGGTAALLDRLSAVEAALRSGAAVKTPAAETTVQVSTGKAEAAEQNQEAESTQNNTESSAPRELTEWQDIIAGVRKSNMPLAAMLADSAAFVMGASVVIKTSNSALSGFLRQGGNSSALRDAIQAATGTRYKLAIKHTKEAGEQEQRTDPLLGLLERADELGIDIKKV